MKALTWHGSKDVRLETVADPVLQAADDAAALALLQADPAVTTETFIFELHRWSWIDWQAAGARSK